MRKKYDIGIAPSSLYTSDPTRLSVPMDRTSSGHLNYFRVSIFCAAFGILKADQLVEIPIPLFNLVNSQSKFQSEIYFGKESVVEFSAGREVSHTMKENRKNKLMVLDDRIAIQEGLSNEKPA